MPAVTACLTHGSPLVRGMAVWALRCLLDEEGYRALCSVHVPREVDDTVLGEWG